MKGIVQATTQVHPTCRYNKYKLLYTVYDEVVCERALHSRTRGYNDMQGKTQTKMVLCPCLKGTVLVSFSGFIFHELMTEKHQEFDFEKWYPLPEE